MAINPTCDKCGSELVEFGAIILSPPDKDGNVKKLHICKGCYKELAEWLN
ncbi:hypothetical protein KC950_03615 [Candidatus Saccharibacteria bacterium]|nr:hypothetical protein [Candidatus Saccharibacteria bacterium]